MMYLVYTAMLALNVSAEVINGFKSVGSAMQESNKNIAAKLDDTYTNFDLAFQNSPDKVRDMYNRAQEIKRLSADITSYIDSVEFTFIGSKVATMATIDQRDADGGKLPPRKIVLRDDEGNALIDSVKLALDMNGINWLTDKQLEDNHNPANFFLGQSGVVMEDKAAFQIKQKIINFKQRVNEALGEDSSHVKMGLDMSDGYDKDGKSVSWELLNFNEVITGAALVTLTRLKAETMNAEFDAVNMLYKKVSKGDMSFDQIAMITRPTKGTYIIQGGTYEAKINVGAYDSRQKFTATVNGQQLTSGDSGSVVYRTTCNSLGPQRVTGVAYVTSPDGGTKEYPINDVYYVAKPAGVVRLDGLQVVYAGLDNPITISAAGIDTRNLSASVDGGQASITRGEGEGSYIIKPAPGSKALNINVDATIDRRTTRVGSQRVIVKDIPPPILKINGIETGGKISKKDIADGTVVIPSKDPNFLLKIDNRMIRIVKMVVSVGAKEEPVQGPRFNEQAASIVRKANRGDKLVISAEVMMPDGKAKPVIYTATLK
ncbi:MAG: hypothetical protein J6I49_04380 [Bacteroidales bacterium]|nr:hypothetical protein [Bacteroidales bacterium]